MVSGLDRMKCPYVRREGAILRAPQSSCQAKQSSSENANRRIVVRFLLAQKAALVGEPNGDVSASVNTEQEG